MDNLFKKLDEIIDAYDNFIIMAHANPDLDALGSSLALYYRIISIHKKASIFLDTRNLSKYDDSIQKSITKLTNVNFVNEKNYEVNDQTLLFVLDVHSGKRLEYPEILEKSMDKVVLDHHIKRRDFIHKTIYSYIDSNLSSMVEMMAKYNMYCGMQLEGTISSIMLAGLEIDTNDYNLKTTAETYRTAAYLMDNNADVILKQELLKETKDEYVKRADYIKHSFRVNNNIAMCVLTEQVTTQTLAEIADDLLKLVDVEASFAVAPINEEKVGISARSMGNMDIEDIISKLGGGGSKTNAAAQLKIPLREVKKQILQLLG